MGRNPTLRARRAEATRTQLLSVATDLFAANGYGATPVEEIIQRAGVARGALYHHFNGKDALLRAVYESVQADAAARVLSAVAGAPDPWQGLRAGMSTFLDACLEPAFRRIVILDSVAVLSHDGRPDDLRSVEPPVLRDVLAPMVETYFPDLPLMGLAHITLGGLYGAALWIARSPEPGVARAEADMVLDMLIDGLRSSEAAAHDG